VQARVHPCLHIGLSAALHSPKGNTVSLSTQQVATLVATIAIVVLLAHAVGGLFARYRQPAVVGEILAGLIFGPTVLGLLAPGIKELLFPTTGPIAAILAGVAQLGMLLLMFITGSELRLAAAPRDRRTIGLVSITGLLLPFAIGLAVVSAIDYQDLAGPTGTRTTTILVFAIAVAVTSIPVISRIMLDLGLLGRPFARIVLGVAALDDVALYVVLAVVLSLASAKTTEFGLWQLTGVESTGWTVTYHVVVTVIVLMAFLLWGTPLLRFLLYGPPRVLSRRNPTAYRLALLLVTVLLCTVLGINPIFGALLIGLCARRAESVPPGLQEAARSADRSAMDPRATAADDGEVGSWTTIRQFSLAFFIPVYFFNVGLGLNLIQDFDPVFFLWFFLLCCVVKAASVLVGALLAGQPLRWSTDLAIALNARGGPGIVLATTTLAAGIVNKSFYTSMVLLSVLTSQMAGTWLERRLPTLRGGDEPSPAPDRAAGEPAIAGQRTG
jgi:Kef-type K+ transport system membrane component KefB